MINTVLIGYFAKIPRLIGILACTLNRVIFVTVFATSYMVIGGHNRPANALYNPPNRPRRRIREIRGFFHVFSFYKRFCFCGYVGVRIGEETIVNTIRTTRPVTIDFTGVFLKKFPEMVLPRKKNLFFPVTDTVFYYERSHEFHSDLLEAG